MSKKGIITTRHHGIGGNPYIAGAVHFDGATDLTRAPLSGVVDSPTGLLACWLKLDAAGMGTNFGMFFDNANADVEFFARFTGGNFLGCNLYSLDQTHTIQTQSTGVLVDNTWLGLVFSWDVNFDIGSRKLQQYANGVPFGAPDLDLGAGGFNVDVSNFDISVASQGGFSFITGDMADFQMWLGNPFVDLTDPSNLALFISGGKPVNPSVASAALGAPVILFSGDASTFATNQGTGGAFTLTGTLTNASTSPSD